VKNLFWFSKIVIAHLQWIWFLRVEKSTKRKSVRRNNSWIAIQKLVPKKLHKN